MLSKVSETTMHRVRWVLALGWLLVVASLFYDPVTQFLLAPTNTLSPFRLNPSVYLDPTRCPKIQGQCVVQDPQHMGAMIWWTIIVPASILILISVGHEFWRRICPLSFMSQIPRALGIQRKRKIIDSRTGAERWEVVTIGQNSWLGRNALNVQFTFFLVGLSARLLFVNADRTALGVFLLGTMLSAVLVGYLYAGKSWCQYFCPMAPVQVVYTGPRALLGSQAHLHTQATTTQSMCRTVDPNTGQEQSACVGCKAHCIDIDAEDSYWAALHTPGRDIVAFGYLGAVIAFYFYYWLYSGDWSYYFSGAWTREKDQLAHIFDPGFYINGVSIPIPKLVAVPLTFLVFVTASVVFGRLATGLLRKFQASRGYPITLEKARHIMFSLFTAVSFWTFFTFGARPWINRLHPVLFYGFNALIGILGFLWLLQNIGRTRAQYEREQVAASFRKQLPKMIDLNLLELDGRTLDELSADAVHTLFKTVKAYLPQISQQSRLQAYVGVVQDLLEQRVVTERGSLKFFAKLRQDLNLTDADHLEAMQTIAVRHPALMELASQSPLRASLRDSETIARTFRRKRRDQTVSFDQEADKARR